jgi:outer membrane usher protein
MAHQTSRGQTLLLTVEINQSTCPEILMGTLTPHELTFSLEDLKKCGLHIPSKEQVINLKKFSDITYKIDKEQLKISINAPIRWFKTQSYKGDSSRQTNNIPQSLYSMALNYDVSGHKFVQQNFIAGLPEVILFTPQGCGKAGFLARTTGKEKLLRLETYWIKENSEKMEQFRWGDAVSAAPVWGGSARISGFQWSTNFSSQPNFIPFPQVAVHGEAAMPTSVDILLDNTRLYQQQVKAGPYEIVDLPVVTGGVH